MDLQTAYYVTFIDGGWVGGWAGTESLIPFSNAFRSPVKSAAEDLTLRRAMLICEASLRLSLSERLRLHSFVAYAVSISLNA